MDTNAADDVRLTDGLAAARCGDVLFALWKLAPKEESYAWLEAFIDELAADHPSFIVCQLILPTSTPPNARLRARGRETLERLRGRMRRLVSVPLGDALWMTVVRVVMRGLTIITGHSETSTIARTASDGLEYIAAVAGPTTPDRAQLIDTLEQVCAKLDVTLREIGLARPS